jgi:predicted acetyltransferase
MIDIRPPQESDRPAIVALMKIAFNPSPSWERLVAPSQPFDRVLCAYEEGRIVAMAEDWRLFQYYAGRPQPMAGVAAVTSAPEKRGGGLAPEVLRAVLRRARAEGTAVSSLYPSRAGVYRRLGYEYAGILTQYRMPLADLPSSKAAGVEEMVEADLPAMQECYRRFAARFTGMVDSHEERWWRMRVVRRWNPDVASRQVVVRGASGIEGYATFQLDALPETWGYKITCTHLISETASALSALLGYFRSFRGLGAQLVWYGAPQEPIGLLIGGGAESIQATRQVRFMTRILDVADALRRRGAATDVKGEALLAVRDELFPENEGPFRIRAEGGRIEVAPAGGGAGSGAGGGGTGGSGAAGAAIGIGALSALYSGYMAPADLVRAGLVRGDEPALDLLGRLCAGPTPWMTDFF